MNIIPSFLTFKKLNTHIKEIKIKENGKSHVIGKIDELKRKYNSTDNPKYVKILFNR